MFLENFIKENEWQEFVKEYVRNAKKDSRTLYNVISDENIWPFIIGSFFNFLKAPLLLVTSTIERANEFEKEIGCLLGDLKILTFPSLGTNIFYRGKPINTANLMKRLEVVRSLLKFQEEKKPFIVVSTAGALLNLMDIPEANLLETIVLKVGSQYERNSLVFSLSNSGYERVYRVYDKGEFSVRGSIVDIFDITQEMPVRIDFVDDVVDRIILYDIYTQENIKYIDEVSIFPYINPWKIKEESFSFENLDSCYSKKYSIIDLFKIYTGKFGIVVCDPTEVYLKIKSDIDMIVELVGKKEKNLVIKDKANLTSYMIDKDFLEKEDFETRLNLCSTKTEATKEISFVFNKLKNQKKSLGNSTIFIKNLKDDLNNNRKVLISIENNDRIKKVEEILLENSLSCRRLDSRNKGNTNLDFSNLDSGVVNIFTSKLYHGYQSSEFSLYGELDIYEQILSDAKATWEVPGKAFEVFKPGDYVVHKTHGIGKYVDIITTQVNGYKREYFLIEYANSDKLYVPTWQIDRLHRYIGDERPQVSPLDSKKWESLKNKVRKSVHKLALDLAKLYAEREEAMGFAFPQDSPWQKEIEDLFPFKETQDQLKAIEYVKKAMEKPIPMDVLVCGDVGFGKTEVAIRAAFKAIEAGKQVLMLVPTTILANQHYQTFSERYKDYPVIVEVISRFKTRKEQERIVEDFSEGKIDMLIGTHRLLEDDIKPKDLGLLIIDEEQRFGVNSKERLKLLKKEVDVLTLTATPIPRTLYMTLTDIRDLVLMQTSPEGRYPIETFVGERDDYIIKMAIEREISRGGQVYYVYNRIFDIENVKNRLQVLVPEAKIALTHGRMESRKIEEVMNDFISQKYDVLLTTSIIESGMDIGNVNTLIVENSHRFGLSQLYQLRGRVGRSFERAYAYFFYPTKSHLNFDAFQRLKTLAEYTELGSGYSIALKDLEIRGAGELLGARQHGHINSVGFDMYCQIIREEIEKLKGNVIEEDINVQIDLPVSAYIPKNYIKNEKERLSVYKRLAEVNSFEEVDKVVGIIEERYGKLPIVAENLANITRIKSLLKKARIEKIMFVEGKGIVLKKVDLLEKRVSNISAKNKNLTYRHREKEIVLRNFDKNMDLNLVLASLSDIISFI